MAAFAAEYDTKSRLPLAVAEAAIVRDAERPSAALDQLILKSSLTLSPGSEEKVT